MRSAGVMSAKGGRRESEIGLDFLREEKDIQMTEEEICKRFCAGTDCMRAGER